MHNRFSILAEPQEVHTPLKVHTPIVSPPSQPRALTPTKPDEPEKGGPTCVFIGHVKSPEEWDDVVDIASECGKIKHVSKFCDNSKSTKHRKGFGFITMQTHQAAEKLIDEIGEDDIEINYHYDYDYSYIRMVRFPILHAEWARPRENSPKIAKQVSSPADKQKRKKKINL